MSTSSEAVSCAVANAGASQTKRLLGLGCGRDGARSRLCENTHTKAAIARKLFELAVDLLRELARRDHDQRADTLLARTLPSTLAKCPRTQRLATAAATP